ncbi:MAG TPA: Uma2 family endonuclease [Polyangiaceae bacterium]|jgi:Uma2 family endonuclease
MTAMLDVTQLSPEQRRPITRVEFQAMGEAGLFERERVELLEGVIVRVSPASAPHEDCIERLSELLVPRLVGRARVRINLAYAASEYSEPVPDVAIVARDEPRGDHPAHALLLIEVSLSSLRFDRKHKARIYAQNAVPEYWVVDVEGRRVEVLSQPTADGYQSSAVYARGEQLSVPGFPDVALSVDSLFE